MQRTERTTLISILKDLFDTGYLKEIANAEKMTLITQRETREEILNALAFRGGCDLAFVDYYKFGMECTEDERRKWTTLERPTEVLAEPQANLWKLGRRSAKRGILSVETVVKLFGPTKITDIEKVARLSFDPGQRRALSATLHAKGAPLFRYGVSGAEYHRAIGTLTSEERVASLATMRHHAKSSYEKATNTHISQAFVEPNSSRVWEPPDKVEKEGMDSLDAAFRRNAELRKHDFNLRTVIEIRALFDKYKLGDPLIIWGRDGTNSTAKGHRAVHLQHLLDTLAEFFFVVTVDEYMTSKRHHSCLHFSRDTRGGKSAHSRLRHCSDEKCPNHSSHVDRDYGSSVLIDQVTCFELCGYGRPPELTRPSFHFRPTRPSPRTKVSNIFKKKNHQNSKKYFLGI